MAETIVFASVTLIFLLILLQKVSIRLLYKDKLTAEIDYSLFTVILTDFKNKRGGKKLKAELFAEAKRSTEFLLRNSEITVSEIKIKSRNIEPKRFILRYKNLFSLFAAVTVYLSKKAKKLILDDSALSVTTDESVEKTSLDIIIKSPLYIILITASMFLLINLKNKKLIKLKRGQNV